MNYTIENDRAIFPCGCSFAIDSFREDGSPRIRFNPDISLPNHDINWECSATYDLLSKGWTNGVFQLESNLGKNYVKKLKPTDINDMINLGAILRPGVLMNVDEEGISLTDHYCLRKNQLETIEYKYEVLKPILESTMGILVMQEQSLKIAQLIAGFTLVEADALRSAIGKKLVDKMHQLKSIFIDKGSSLGVVPKEDVEEIFSWIEKSQKYAFNKSHSAAYGVTGYVTAYEKAHFPLEFMLMKLRGAKEEQHTLEEIDKFIEDAKLFDITVLPPDITKMNETFWSDRKDIYFGLADIKGIGKSQFKKFKDAPIDSWINFLLYNTLSSTTIDGLIRSGALRCFGLSRKTLLEEYRVWNNLTDSVVKLAKKLHEESPKDNLIDLLESLLGLPDGKKGLLYKSREKIESEIKLLKNPPSSLADTHSQICAWEIELLGNAVTSGRINAEQESKANCSIKDLLTGIVRYPIVCAQILEVKFLVTKKGKNPGARMCSIRIEDNSAKISVVVFPDAFEQLESFLVTGACLYMNLERLQDGNYQLKKVWDIT